MRPLALMDALEAGDDRDLAALEAGRAVAEPSMRLYARRAMGVVGQDRDLPAEPGARRKADVLQRYGQEPGGHLLAGGDDGIIFALVVQSGGVLAPGDQLIGLARHGRDHDGDLVARLHLALHMERDIADALHIGDRGAAEFHHQTSHDRPRLETRARLGRAGWPLASDQKRAYM